MRKQIILLAAAILLVLPIKAEAALQCVTYAREVTGLNLKGDAWRWWEAADGLYNRGNAPKEGAVLVFKRQGSMVHGHVSVVRKAVNSRVVLVDHANWAPRRSAGRGKVAEAVPVMDVSPKNDWTQVRVWYEPAGQYGDRVYKTTGFVYRPASAPVVSASLKSETKVRPELAPAPTVTAKPTLSLPEDEVAAQPAPQPQVQPVAAPVEPAGNGKFDARPWAEQA